jgi:SAM-dependent methyltransferase
MPTDRPQIEASVTPPLGQRLRPREMNTPSKWKGILSNATMYHHARHFATGGMPFERWTELYGLTDTNQRIADLGCGPADILRYLSRGRRPAFYLGVDISEKYLQAARERSDACGIDAEFIPMDLTRLTTDAEVQERIVQLLEQHRITRVLLLGVLHHIDDASALQTLNLVESVRTVQTMITQDVIRVPGSWINNRYCDMDRGGYIRDEAGYDSLISRSDWPRHSKFWSSPKLRFLRYVHYELSK